jgi:hypothetical protein
MAYARFSSSDWYIFWSCYKKYPEHKGMNTKEVQTLEVWHVSNIQRSYTYQELLEEKGIIERDFPNLDCTEALECVDDFLADVDRYSKDGELLC